MCQEVANTSRPRSVIFEFSKMIQLIALLDQAESTAYIKR